MNTENTKWTPGPWSIEGFCDFGDYLEIKAPNGDDIATVMTPAEGRKEANATARLIAAAPEMAEALANCITEPGAMAERSHEYALRRLDAITETARAILARVNGEGGGV